jgi:hypothetical protein
MPVIALTETRFAFKPDAVAVTMLRGPDSIGVDPAVSKRA